LLEFLFPFESDAGVDAVAAAAALPDPAAAALPAA